MLHASAYDMPVGGSKKKKNHSMELCVCVWPFFASEDGIPVKKLRAMKSQGERKKNSFAKEKKYQRIGIIGIIQGGWAQSGGVSALGESFRHPQRESVCTISHANSDPCSE